MNIIRFYLKNIKNELNLYIDVEINYKLSFYKKGEKIK